MSLAQRTAYLAWHWQKAWERGRSPFTPELPLKLSILPPAERGLLAETVIRAEGMPGYACAVLSGLQRQLRSDLLVFNCSSASSILDAFARPKLEALKRKTSIGDTSNRFSTLFPCKTLVPAP